MRNKCPKCIMREWKDHRKKFRSHCYRVTLFLSISMSFRPFWRLPSTVLSSDFWTLVKCTVIFIPHQPPAPLPETVGDWVLTLYTQTVLTTKQIDMTLLRICANTAMIKSTIKPEKGLLLLLLSRFSRVQLCVTPETAAHQAPPSLGFSRQEKKGLDLCYSETSINSSINILWSISIIQSVF